MKKYQLIFACCVIMVLFLSSPVLAQTKSKEFTGYLSDVACATKAMAGDGADLTTNPEKHTVACLKMPACMASGYGILIKGMNYNQKVKDNTGLHSKYQKSEKWMLQ